MGNVWQKSYIDVHEATQSGHIDEVRRWVDAGKPVDARDNTQKTPLHYAAQWGQEEALDFLIECGAEVNATDFIEDTPLHLACYFGHANCARILIMVGADVGAKDCYGNIPSQIFDDHVTEPVLDEIRFVVREVTKGPCPAEEPEYDVSGSASVPDQEISNGGPLRDSIGSTAAPRCQQPMVSKDGGILLPGDGRLESENMGSTEGAAAAGTATERKEVPSPLHDNNKERIANVSASASVEAGETSGPSSIGQPLALGVAQEVKGDQSLTRARNRSRVGFSVQQLPQEAGEGTNGSIVGEDIARDVDGAAGEKEAKSEPSSTFASGGLGLSEPGGLAPRLKLSLPWDDESGPELANTRGLGGEVAKSPIAARASGGSLSARTVGSRGSAAAGLTYPGRRPLSAPRMRPSIGANNLNATSPILSGRTFEGTSVGKDRDLGGSNSLGRTAGASLAGRLMSYATRPGGTFDVFAAARDGQVSVLKQALTEGEEVDVQDEAGLTALMWAARAGRLSTAKYLVSQGASLERRDEATGFSPLHFAAYYCRSSVVRVLVLAGADTKATDNRGRTPGARFQPLSFLSYEAFHHRRLIKRFLAGDMKDGMDDKGKTMFPMNSPLEAYDEEHRPQCVRLGSGDNLTVHSDQSSAEEGLSGSNEGSSIKANRPGSRRSRLNPNPGTSHRRASAEIARKAYATMHTMHSRVIDDDSSTKKKSVSGGAAGGDGGGGGCVRYYLRRGSIQQVAAKTRRILAGAAADDDGIDDDNESNPNSGRSRAVSSPEGTRSSPRPTSTRGGTEGGVNFYLRRSSLPFLEHFLPGGGKGGEDSAREGGTGDDAGGEHDDDAVGTARYTAAAVTRFEAPAAAAAAGGDAAADTTAGRRIVSGGDGDRASTTEERSVFGGVEAGLGSHRSAGNCESGEEGGLPERSRGEEVEGRGAGIGRVPKRLLEGVLDGAKDLATQLQGERGPSDNDRPTHGSPRGDRNPIYENTDVESGMRTMPPPEGEASPVSYPDLEQRHPRENAAAAASPKYLETGAAIDLASGGKGGDASSMAQPHGGRGISGAAEGKSSTNEGTLAPAAVLPLSDSATDGKATAAEFDSPNVGDEEGAGSEHSGGGTSAFEPPRAADGGHGAGNAVSAERVGDDPTSHRLGEGRGAVTAEGAAPRGAGVDCVSTERESRPEEGLATAKEQQLALGPSNPVEGNVVQGHGQPCIHPRQPGRHVVSSSASRSAETSGDVAAAAAVATPFSVSSSIDLQSREPADILSVGSMPSVGEEKGEGGMGDGIDVDPVLSGEESTSKRHRSGRSEGKSSSRKSHKHKHKRSHRHRDKSSDEGGSKSHRRRSRDHGLAGGTSASTIAALAPLKRIPPPSSSLARRAIHEGAGPVEEPSSRTGGGNGGGGGGGG